MRRKSTTPVPELTRALSRRQFLKFCLTGIVSISLPREITGLDEPLPELGRVLEDEVKVYLSPSFTSPEIASVWRDSVIPLAEATLGDQDPVFNRVWYSVKDGGYIHSGSIQPVRHLLNDARNDIGKKGILAEVTVPFTDTRWRADKNISVAYRLYYETTHWVTDLVYDSSGEPWYRIAEDRWKFHHYALAKDLRLISPDELAPISPLIPIFGKRIEVNTIEQVVIAYEWDQPVFMTKTATGAKFSNGNYSTPTGRYITAHKRPSRHMAAGNLAYNGYDLPGVPWICYITENGISFHGTYWHNNFGRPRSHGCINLTPKAAKWIYLWTLPVVPTDMQIIHEKYGTAVEVI